MLKKALIFGITGQDGYYLSKLLILKNYKVYGVTRYLKKNYQDNNNASNVKLYELKTYDIENVYSIIKKINPDEVYNLSGVSSVSKSFEIPQKSFSSIFDLNLSILDTLKKLKSFKYYYACSSECYGETNLPANENTPFRPLSPYAVGKASSHMMIELYKKAYDIFACSGILFNHESSRRPENFVTRKVISTTFRISNGSKEKLELGNLDIVRDWGWAPEYVEAMWLMLQQNKPENYVIATGESHSLEEFVKNVFNRFGLDWKKYVRYNKNYDRLNDLKLSLADPKKAKKQLFWEAKTKFDDVIFKMISEVKK